jgi:hypothetical protein
MRIPRDIKSPCFWYVFFAVVLLCKIYSCNSTEYFQTTLDGFLENRGSPEFVAGLLYPRLEQNDLNSVLGQILPDFDEKILVDTLLDSPNVFRQFLADNKIELIYDFLEAFEEYVPSIPIDWQADPYNDRTWLLYYHSLKWLNDMVTSQDLSQILTVGAVINDWVESVLFGSNSPFFTWYDHALVIRLGIASNFIQEYLLLSEKVDPKLLYSAVQVVISHLYALCSEQYYRYDFIPYNHGMMMDLGLLDHLPLYPALRDGKEMQNLACSRINQQFTKTVTTDGINVENSPSYHYFILSLVSHAIDTIDQAQEEMYQNWLVIQDKMIDTLAFLMQPNNTFPQFGDTPNVKYDYQHLIRNTRLSAEEVEDRYPSVVYVFKQGLAGVAPEMTDKVFSEGGYASFRSAWGDADSFLEDITLHAKFSHLSDSHYHCDDGTFSLYGAGHEILVDSGYFSYSEDEYNDYSRSAFAHNVLVIDGVDYDKHAVIPGGSGIIDYHLGEEISFVRGTNPQYKNLGIEQINRTIVHIKPKVFILIDEIHASSGHVYEQHFHFHPSYDLLDDVAGMIVASSSIEEKPSLVMYPFMEMAELSDQVGVNSEGRVRGWYFNDFQQKTPAKDIAFIYQENQRLVYLVVYLEVVGVGESVQQVGNTYFESKSNSYYFEWEQNGRSYNYFVQFD